MTWTDSERESSLKDHVRSNVKHQNSPGHTAAQVNIALYGNYIFVFITTNSVFIDMDTLFINEDTLYKYWQC